MAKTYNPIATTTLGSAASSITFSSIPNTYTDLRLVFVGTSASNGQVVTIQFNSDTATNYSWIRFNGDGATASAISAQNVSSLQATYQGTSTTIPIMCTWDVFSYTGSTYKTVLMSASEDKNGSGGTGVKVGMWRSTSAINTILITINGAQNFNSGTTATLYGIKAA